MKKRIITAVLAVMVTAILLFSGCQKRQQAEEYIDSFQNSSQEEDEKNQEENSLLPEKLEISQEEKENEDETENEITYKIESSGFEITIPENWSAFDIPEPMGAMLMRDNSANNSASISYCEGEEKEQKEKDFESIFESLKADTEINDYNITKNKKDGFYQILLSYNQLQNDRSYLFSYVLYQQTDKGLIEISFKLKDQFPKEIKEILSSIQKETDKAVPMPMGE